MSKITATTEKSPDETKTCPLCGGRVFWFPISNYWGCERCKNTFNRYTVFPDEVKKTSVSAVGNMAAMREALKELLDAMYGMGIDEETVSIAAESTNCPAQSVGLLSVIKKAKAALSVSPRNCDVGTAEEQAERFNSFCDEHSGGIGGMCDGNCPCFGCVDGCHCLCKWEQMQYKEEGGEK